MGLFSSDSKWDKKGRDKFDDFLKNKERETGTKQGHRKHRENHYSIIEDIFKICMELFGTKKK